MPDIPYESTDILTIIQKLVTSTDWDTLFSLLEQEQARLVLPEAEAILLALFEHKEQQNAPNEEIADLARYLPLLRDMRVYGLLTAWETFTYALLDDETRQPISTAFTELENAETGAEMRLIFENNRSLFLSEAAEQFRQHLYAFARCSSNGQGTIDDLHRLRTFFDLQRQGDETRAWKLLDDFWEQAQAKEQQQTEEIFNTLYALEDAETLADVRALLEKQETYLLTVSAEQVLDFLIQKIAVDSGDPHLQFLIQMRDFLLYASATDMHQAIEDSLTPVYTALLAIQRFALLLDEWLGMTTTRAERRFLEQHKEIAQPYTITQLQLLIQEHTENPEIASSLNALLDLLQEILQQGGTVQAIRRAYVDKAGGLALDIPPWLEEIETRLQKLAEQSEPGNMYIEYVREAITLARQDANVAPEVIATLQNELGTDLRNTPPDDPFYAANQEEALATQISTLQIFTSARYPTQYTRVLLELGVSYMERVEGKRSENLEQALTCNEIALQYLNKTNFPLDWARAQVRLGDIYHERIDGDKSHNLECALQCLHAAQEIYLRDTFPVEWAKIQFGLGDIYHKRTTGDKRENIQRSAKHYQQTLQVYTRDTFPQDFAITHLMLGALYTDFGPVIEIGTAIFVQALEHYQQAEQILTRETHPVAWALIQQGMMGLAVNTMDGSKEQDLQQAIKRGEAAVSILTQVAQPLEWANTHVRLGEVYSLAANYANSQMGDDSRDNMLEQALGHIQMACQVYTPENAPEDWAEAQRIQGEIYFARSKGDRNENLRLARRCCESALQACSPRLSALQWARTQTILGSILLSYPAKQKETIEQAIGCFKASLELCHPVIDLVPWARNQLCLCHAYIERVEEDHQQNIELAIEHGLAASQVFNSQNAPLGWAETQFYLGAAYMKRLADEHRANIEQAILCFENATQILTRESAPLLWAPIQINLSAAYIERSEGITQQNATYSMQYAQKALEIYTEENASLEWCTLQFRLGLAYHNHIQHTLTTAAAQQAEKHYLLALRGYTNNNDPLNAALVKLHLGSYYQTLALAGNGVANKQQALSWYHAASQTLTKETYPMYWAMVQLGLGASLAYIHTDRQAARIEQEQAVNFLRQAMSVFTSEIFPENYRRILKLILAIEWQRGKWKEVAQLSQAIYEVEENLLRTSIGTSGLDKILTQGSNPSSSALGAFAWLLQKNFDQKVVTTESGWAQDRVRSLVLSIIEPEYIEQAAITLERGRAQDLARTTALYLAAPERIKNPERRTRYINARNQLEKTRATLAKMAALNHSETITIATRQNFLDCTSACAAAQRAFDEVITEIKETGDPAEFFATAVDRNILQQAVTQFGPGHTLVYLIALETIGGFALAVQAPRKPGDLLHFEACMLPGLTSNLIQDLMKHGPEPDLYSCQQKLVHVLLRPLLRWFQRKLDPVGLTLIPCGYLAGLPLATLLIDNDETLADKFPTSFAPSARSLLSTQIPDNPREGVFAFGNPQIDLLWSESEAYALQHIASQLHIESHRIVQKGVTSKAFRGSLGRAMVIDLACHGKVKPDDYLQSYLQFANRERLTLGTVLGWKREMQGLRLLILSACQAATPDLKGATEEVRSLTSGMLQAGSRAVLAPLWRVNDRATFLLMTHFAQEWFPHMHIEPPAIALARAQRWLRNVTNEELQHWEAKILNQPGKTEQETMAHDQIKRAKLRPEASRFPVLQEFRYELDEAEKRIRRDALHNPTDSRPYADPIYWAGFQIVGW